jgi:hypothetical protein
MALQDEAQTTIPIPVLPMETVIIILTLYYFPNYYFLASFRIPPILNLKF